MDARLAVFRERVAEAMASTGVPGMAIAVVQNGNIIFSETFGMRAIEGQLPVTPETLFKIGSVTKTFTALLAAILARDGALDLDRPVRDILSWFRLMDSHASDHVTTRDFLCHRSGLPAHNVLWWDHPDLSRRELCERMAYLRPSAQLHEKPQYSNLGYILVGQLVEEVTGRTWEQLVQERILNPLGMTASVFGRHDPICNMSNIARPYDSPRGELRGVALPGPDRSVGAPAGLMAMSNLVDMAKFVSFHLGRASLGECPARDQALIDEVHAPRVVWPVPAKLSRLMRNRTYGMGWWNEVYRGRQRIYHSGHVFGFSSQLTLFPDDALGIFIVCNMHTLLADALTLVVADALLGLAHEDWVGWAAEEENQLSPKRELPPARAEGLRVPEVLDEDEYVGFYHHPAFGVISISAPDGVLTMGGVASSCLALHRVKGEVYEMLRPVWGVTPCRFVRDLAGTVCALQVALEPGEAPAEFVRQAK